MNKSVFFILLVLPLLAQAQVPTIVSFSPKVGPVGTMVTLSGSNFDPLPSDNVVYFGGVQAEVLSATASSLTVEVPKGASHDFIFVNVKGLIAQSVTPYIVTFDSDTAIGRLPDTFADEMTFEAANEPYGLDVGDLDRDGLVDVVTGNFSGKSFSVFRNTSSGSGNVNFSTKSDIVLGAQANDVKLADFDGDGLLDLVAVTEDAMGTPFLEISRNITSTVGSINFTSPTIITHDGYNYVVEAADFNGDGKIDIAVLDSDHAVVSFYENSSTSGAINFKDDVDFPIGTDPYDLTVGDMNSDGLLDVISLDGSTNTISVLENTTTGGNISFAAKVDFAVNPSTSSYWLSIGDLNGDDLPEVVVQNGGSVSIFRNETNTSLALAAPDEITVTIANGPITLDDFNGDGKPDLLLNGQINQVVLLKNTSSGANITFASDVKFGTSSNQYPTTFLSTDLDADGETDLVGTTYHGIAFNDYKVEVLRNHSSKSLFTDFSFAEEVEEAKIDESSRTIEISVAGVSDLTTLKATFKLSNGATASIDGIPQSSGVTTSDFTDPVIYTILAEDGSTSQDWTVTVSLVCVLDETDLTEVACSSYDFDGQIISSSGTYMKSYINRFGCDSTVTVDLTINPTSFYENVYAVGSYDFDGVAINTSGQYAYGPFTSTQTGCDSTFFLNLTIEPDTYDPQNYVQFKAKDSTFPVIEEQGASHIEDLNGDGEKDVFIIGKSSTGVIATLLINDGDGTFTENAGHGISGARVGNRTSMMMDVNGDDVLDFLVIGKSGGLAITKLYLNDGTGQFLEKTDHGLPDLGIRSITSYLDSADVDGDDDLDLIISIYDAADYDSYQSQLWLNNGDGSFILSTVNDFPALTFSLADFADLDGDGDPDLLLRGLNEPYKVWLNDGSGVFTQKLDRSLATLSSKGMVIFDVDNDGDLDIYDSNTSTHSGLYTAIYFNNGDGSFTYDLSSKLPRLDGYGAQAGCLSKAADIDNDGDLDLIIEGRYRFSGGPSEADYLEVWLNNGFGHFRPLASRTLNQTYPADSYQFGRELGYGNYQSNNLLSVFDFDRDGRADILLNGQEYTTLFDQVSRIISNKQLSGELAVETCDSYEFDGETLTSSGSYQGDYIDESGSTYPVNLDLTIIEPLDSEETVISCGSYEWNGITYTSSGTYMNSFTSSAGCDSTATLILRILEPTSGEQSLSACGSYEWNGTVYSSSGSYTGLFSNEAGCDSTATLNLTILESTSSETSISACDQYDWNGVTYDSSGTYSELFINAAGCDSTATLNLTILAPTFGNKSITACESYTWNESVYTTSGTYAQSFVNAIGCDSTVTVNLTILEPSAGEADVFACDSYEWNGHLYTESGTFYQLFSNVAGCDSTATLNLNIGTSTFSESVVETCDSYDWNGAVYTTTGSYSKLFTNAEGCDSTALLDLTIHQSLIVDVEIAACEGYEFNEEMISTSGEYSALFASSAGCDSLVNLSLTVNEPYFREEILDVCGSYQFGEQLITESGLYLENFTSVVGCDSLVSLTVGMLEEPNDGIESNGRVLFATDNSTGLTYQWYDCDSGERLEGEDKRQLTPPRAGKYFVEITNTVCQVESLCMEITEEDVLLDAERPLSNMEIYPNPSNGPVHLTWEQPRTIELTIIGLDGRVVHRESHAHKEKVILSVKTAGLYVIRVHDLETGHVSDHKIQIR